jgi:Predicted membrane-bound metal-dependent hydrolases
MDLITHAFTGALVAATLAPKITRRPTAIVGGISACLPDVDVLIRSSTDPLLVLEYHRHFTHSLFFSPFGAAVAALILSPLLRRHLSASALYKAAIAGYISACLLDVCTSYGTRLFWPLAPQSIALNWIAVVDPVFTLLIAIGLVFTLRGRNLLPWFGLAAGALYLGVGALQLQRAESAARQWADVQSLPIEKILAKPTLGNLVLWRVLLVNQNNVQVIAVRAGVSSPQIYVGDHAELLDLATLSLPESSRAYQDVQRFYQVSEGYLVTMDGAEDHIGDLRYAMLPTSVVPLWGIIVDKQNPAGETRAFTRRDSSPQVRDAFMRMLTGEPLHGDPPL